MTKEERELRRAIEAELADGNAGELLELCAWFDREERAAELTDALLARAARK